MAYKIIGTIHSIGATEIKQSKDGNSFQRRSLTLMQRRFNPNTGEEYEPNFPTFDFSQRHCEELDKFQHGSLVQITFDAVGVKYNDRQTGEEKYFNSLRAFKIEHYVRQQQPPQQPPQAMQPSQSPSQAPLQNSPQTAQAESDELPF